MGHRSFVHVKGRGHNDGFKMFLDDVIVITLLCALVLRFNHFTGDIVCPLEVFGKNIRLRANLAKRLREWGTDVDPKPHFASNRETKRRKASRH